MAPASEVYPPSCDIRPLGNVLRWKRLLNLSYLESRIFTPLRIDPSLSTVQGSTFRVILNFPPHATRCSTWDLLRWPPRGPRRRQTSRSALGRRAGRPDRWSSIGGDWRYGRGAEPMAPIFAPGVQGFDPQPYDMVDGTLELFARTHSQGLIGK